MSKLKTCFTGHFDMKCVHHCQNGIKMFNILSIYIHVNFSGHLLNGGHHWSSADTKVSHDNPTQQNPSPIKVPISGL